MFPVTRHWRVVLAGTGLALLLTAPSPSPADVGAMRSCVESNAPRVSSVQTLVMRVQDAEGLVSETRAKVYWRRFEDGHRRILVRMEAPEELAHAGVLVIAPPRQLGEALLLEHAGHRRGGPPNVFLLQGVADIIDGQVLLA